MVHLSAEEKERLAREARARIDLEEDPHRAALEDNPEDGHVSAATWLAVFSLAFSFQTPIGLSFLCVAAVVVQIAQELDGMPYLAWIVSSWSLAIACSFSLAGPLSDVFGRRNPIIAGEIVVIAGCICCGCAKDIGTLIAGETLIGLGCGFVFVSYAGVPEMLPNKKRSLGLGILEGGIAFPWGCVSVLVGNAINKNIGWRWIFYFGIILETVALIGTVCFYWPTPRPRGDYDKTRWQELQEIDFLGLVAFIGGTAMFLYGLEEGTSLGWHSAKTLAPLIIGLLVIAAGFAWDFLLCKNPIFPLTLFAMFKQYSVLLLVLFVSGMNFHAMSPLLPQGSLYMFTPDGIQIGIMALPNTLMQGIVGAIAPMFAHRLGKLKWQLVCGMLFQTVFIAASAASVYPNHKLQYVFLPAFGVPMFIWVTILSYAIASLHVPHSMLGVAMGLLGTFRSAGGAIGNAIFNTVLQDRLATYKAEELGAVISGAGFAPELIPNITIAIEQFNIGVPGSGIDAIPGMTEGIKLALREGLRTAYGHAYKIVFYTTIPFSVVALVCSVFVDDPTRFMTNHVSFAMPGRRGRKGAGEVGELGAVGRRAGNGKEGAVHEEERSVTDSEAKKL